MSITPDFSFARYYGHPFSHAWVPSVFTDECNDSIYSWLESIQTWEFTRTNFYEQFEICLEESALPSNLKFITSSRTLDAIGNWLSQIFEGPSLECVDVVAHCLQPGQKMGIHNDHLLDGETHRLLLQLSKDIEGGDTLLFESMEASSLSRMIRPLYGTAFAFPITPQSFHAVSKVEIGPRFTIVFSYRSR